MSDEHSRHNKETEERIISDVKEHGFHIGYISGDSYLPGFAYTIGLYHTYEHPEIICFALKPEAMGVILNHAADLIKKGQRLRTNQLYQGFLEGYQVQFLAVQKEHYPDYLGYAGWFYQDWNFPVLQLLWPDKQHRFPWEADFNPNWKFKQPLLDRNTDFRFYEERNVCVYTTKHFLEGSPILYVYHNEDGDWQFHTEIEPQVEDAILVCLEDVVKRDPTVNQIYYLPLGGCAWRASVWDKWQVEEDSETEEDAD